MKMHDPLKRVERLTNYYAGEAMKRERLDNPNSLWYFGVADGLNMAYRILAHPNEPSDNEIESGLEENDEI